MVTQGSSDCKSQAHQEIVLAFGPVNVEIEAAPGGVAGSGFFGFIPETDRFVRAVSSIHFHPSGVYRGDKLESQFGLAFGRKNEGSTLEPSAFLR
mgnify:CR=1 FL=1